VTNHSVIARDFVSLLCDLRFDDVFNPYTDVCPFFDRHDAAAIRRRNLAVVLEAALRGGVKTVWVARDLGYRGGRRTGLALTDEAHLQAHGHLFGASSLARSTKGPVAAERTATVIWRMLVDIEQPIFLWNAFPLHPHDTGSPLSNRCHTRAERQACRHIMVALLDLLLPATVLAIGRDAENALADIGVLAKPIRHPSYGGQPEFIDGIARHYGLKSAPTRDKPLPSFL
jgi:hypothetical protein